MALVIKENWAGTPFRPQLLAIGIRTVDQHHDHLLVSKRGMILSLSLMVKTARNI